MKKIDARGLECPQPVILIKRALGESDEASIQVDNDAAVANVRRFGENGGYEVTTLEEAGYTELFLKKSMVVEKTRDHEGVVVLIKSDRFGEGDEALGTVLMKSFLVSLLESDTPLKALIFMNRGVHLTTTEGENLEKLIEIAGKGAALYSCGTCLDFYGLKGKLLVGEVTNMYSAVELLVDPRYKTITI